MRFCLAAVALAAVLASHVYGGQLYQFTSTVDLVLTPGAPSIPVNPFAVGQSVVGTFRYSPELAVSTGPPSLGTVDYRNAFSELKLEINLGGSSYRFAAPEVSTTPLAGVPLNYVSIADNMLVEPGGRTDAFRLTHNNAQFVLAQPWTPVDPTYKLGSYYPSVFNASWFTDAPPGQSAFPAFITDYSLPTGLNELFGRSANDNWSLRFDEDWMPGMPRLNRAIVVIGRMTTLQVIPEPSCGVLACVAAALARAVRRSRFGK